MQQNKDQKLIHILDKSGYTKDSKLAPTENQLRSVHWLLGKLNNENQYADGAIIADALGSGKTMQILSLFNLDRHSREVNNKEQHKCSLVIVRSGCIDQWCNEIEKFFHTASLKVIKFSSVSSFVKTWETDGKKEWNVKVDGWNIPTAFFEEADIIITQYSKMITLYNHFRIKEQLNLSTDSDTKWISSQDSSGFWFSKTNGPDLLKYKFRHIIIDEAHEIRNHKTKKSLMIHSFLSDYYWALTATPAYHKDIGIWSILKFIKFKKIPSYSIMKRMLSQVDICNSSNNHTRWFVNLIKHSVRKFDRKKQSITTNNKLINNNNNNDNVCKGTKRSRNYSDNTDIKFSHDLIETERIKKKQKIKTGSKIVWCEEKESNYTDNGTQSSLTTKLYIRDQWIPGFMFSYENEMYEKYKKNFMQQTNIGKKFLEEQNNKENIDSISSPQTNNGNMMSILNAFNKMRYIADDASQFVNNNNENKSTKLNYLLEYLKTPTLFNSQQDKAVVFCERISTCFNIVNLLRVNNIKCVCLNGKIAPPERSKLVSNFTNDRDIKVLVTTFCSESSLNLQIANHVLFVSRWWVKSKLKQCIGRCRRMGQTKDVHTTFLSIDLPIERHIKRISETSGKLCNQTIREFCNQIN